MVEVAVVMVVIEECMVVVGSGGSCDGGIC